MDFSDTTTEAAFRQEVRQWIDTHAPKHLADALAGSSFGSTQTGEFDSLEEAKKWQKQNDSIRILFLWSRKYYERNYNYRP